MKKTMLILAFMLVALGANAQFEQGKWFINPSLTGLSLTYSEAADVHFGLQAKGGAFVVDNFALLVNLGAQFMEDFNTFTAGVGARYYFDATGIYLGAGFDVNRMSLLKHKRTNFGVNVEAGYAFFITKTVTLEPGVYYNWDTKDSDFSELGLKVGFGVYF